MYEGHGQFRNKLQYSVFKKMFLYDTSATDKCSELRVNGVNNEVVDENSEHEVRGIYEEAPMTLEFTHKEIVLLIYCQEKKSTSNSI